MPDRMMASRSLSGVVLSRLSRLMPECRNMRTSAARCGDPEIVCGPKPRSAWTLPTPADPAIDSDPGRRWTVPLTPLELVGQLWMLDAHSPWAPLLRTTFRFDPGTSCPLTLTLRICVCVGIEQARRYAPQVWRHKDPDRRPLAFSHLDSLTGDPALSPGGPGSWAWCPWCSLPAIARTAHRYASIALDL